MKKYAILAIGLCFTLSSARAQRNTQYHLLKTFTIGGEGGWDYLSADPVHRRLYIAHATQVEVYNLDGDTLDGRILNTEGVHGVAIAAEENHGFISCGKSNSVLMFDLRTLDTIQRIAVGQKPDAIVYDLYSHHVFAMNGGSNSVSVIDASDGKLIATIPLPGRPEFAATDQHGHLYVNLEDKSKNVKIDVEKNKVEMVRSVAPGESPSALAIDRGKNRLFIGCANQKIVVMDARSGKAIQSFPIGKGVDAAEFDPFLQLAFSANGEGTVTIIHEITANKFEIVQNLETQRGARTIALDPHTHDIYLVTADFGPAPPPTAEQAHPRPAILPGTFRILKYGPVNMGDQ